MNFKSLKAVSRAERALPAVGRPLVRAGSSGLQPPWPPAFLLGLNLCCLSSLALLPALPRHPLPGQTRAPDPIPRQRLPVGPSPWVLRNIKASLAALRLSRFKCIFKPVQLLKCSIKEYYGEKLVFTFISPPPLSSHVHPIYPLARQASYF